MPMAKVGDLNIHYEVRGQGELLLLIMGYRGNGSMWGEELLQPLSRYFQVITFDNRGTGESDKPNAVYTIPMMADDAADLLHHLGMARAHVFGVSMGGDDRARIGLAVSQTRHTARSRLYHVWRTSRDCGAFIYA